MQGPFLTSDSAMLNISSRIYAQAADREAGCVCTINEAYTCFWHVQGLFQAAGQLISKNSESARATEMSSYSYNSSPIDENLDSFHRLDSPLAWFYSAAAAAR